MQNAKWIGLSVVVLAAQTAWASPHNKLQHVVNLSTTPFTIAEPGTYVVLQNWDVTTTEVGEVLIDITASDVVLDLHGFEIAWDGSDGAVGIAITGNDVTARNGRLEGNTTSTAIRSTGADTTVDEVDVELDLQSYLQGDRAVIRNSQFLNRGGIFVNGTDSRIESSDISDNQGVLVLGPGAQARNNHIAGIQNRTVSIEGDGAIFQNNVVETLRIERDSLTVAGNDNLIVDNTLRFNFIETTVAAIRVAGTRNVIRGNLAAPSATPFADPRWTTGIAFEQDGNFYGNNQMAATVPFDVGGTVQIDLGGNVGF